MNRGLIWMLVFLVVAFIMVMAIYGLFQLFPSVESASSHTPIVPPDDEFIPITETTAKWILAAVFIPVTVIFGLLGMYICQSWLRARFYKLLNKGGKP